VKAVAKRLPVSELLEGMIVDEGVYTSQEIRAPLVAKDTVLTSYLIEKIKNNGVKEVKVSSAFNPSKLITVPKPPPVIGARLRKEALTSLQDMFSMVRQEEGEEASSSKIIKQFDEGVGQLVNALIKDKRTMVNINDLKSYDEYTYHHSLSVTVLSIATAQSLRFSHKSLNQMGKCAMMHDIGKIAVPIQIINKPSRLDAAEFKAIQKHSPEGFKYLSSKDIGDDEMRYGVMYHHEKYDGTGYPLGLKGDEIPLMSRIIAVADVYDALTSNRPYRQPMQPAEAMEYVMGGVSTAFDYDVVMAFLSKMEPYPVGCLVELSNGKIATVINNEFTMRPVVQTLDNGEILDLFNDRRFLDVVIKQMFPDPPAA
jgi:HD-GYP domain-containing protein (c-di-GMP phosphodiesterase class II)